MRSDKTLFNFDFPSRLRELIRRRVESANPAGNVGPEVCFNAKDRRQPQMEESASTAFSEIGLLCAFFTRHALRPSAASGEHGEVEKREHVRTKGNVGYKARRSE